MLVVILLTFCFLFIFKKLNHILADIALFVNLSAQFYVVKSTLILIFFDLTPVNILLCCYFYCRLFYYDVFLSTL